MQGEKTVNKSVKADIVIFGGGIAGLWLLTRLRQAGFTAILFESQTLGGGQTNKAQGIIHGGMKYALQGVMTTEAQAMADMPTLWRSCLQGQGEISLSNVPILSPEHYLWAPNKLAAKIGGFLAGAALSSKVNSLPKQDFPSVFQHPSFKGEVFALNEIVVDVPALVRELTKLNQGAIFKIDPLTSQSFNFDEQNKLKSVVIAADLDAIEVKAEHFVFAAGAGNEIIINQLKHPDIAMQRRPLHMVLVKTPFNYPLYAHCLGFGARPRITVTTHYRQDGKAVWYLGGLLAEEGVNRDQPAQIKATNEELRALFPWLDFSAAEFSTFMIDRAEPKQKSGFKPETAYSRVVANITIAWPTKLALAPQLAAQIMHDLHSVTSKAADLAALSTWPIPALATPIWENTFCKNIA